MSKTNQNFQNLLNVICSTPVMNTEDGSVGTIGYVCVQENPVPNKHITPCNTLNFQQADGKPLTNVFETLCRVIENCMYSTLIGETDHNTVCELIQQTALNIMEEFFSKVE